MNIDYWLKCYGSPTAGVSIDDPLQAAVDLAAEVLRLREQLSGRTMHCANCEAMAREVEALRERDAAWEWLADWSERLHGNEVYRRKSDMMLVARSIGQIVEATAPDPVALARGLGRKDGE